ncbi:MAG: ABC transporter ATP-binding protein [Desulfarculus sp.]|nr:ABC transporter ATP-binding protein [Desulfarculus sp.]
MLEVRDLHVYYGAVHALKGVSLEVPQGGIVTLVGANGAGKSTLLKAIAGLLPARQGSIRLEGQEISSRGAEGIVAKGLCLVPEGRQVFGTLKVIDNLNLGAFLLRGGKHQAKRQELLDYVYDLFPILEERQNQYAGTLSGGQQQMLAIGRALMANPRILVLDEPSMGLAPLVVREILKVLGALNQKGLTILLVEQNARAALKVASYGYVLETGGMAAQGEAKALLSDQNILKAYLGG